MIAGKIVMNHQLGIKGCKGVTLPPFAFMGSIYLVHAEVTGYAPIEGVRYAHAWVEDDHLVYDYSNGNSLWILKEKYYEIGQVRKEEGSKMLITFLKIF